MNENNKKYSREKNQNKMTVCGPKAVEANTMNTSNRSSVANRPSFMITDILSSASSDKLPMQPLATNYLEHLKRFSAMEHEYRMQMPSAEQRKEFCDSDDDDFHGSDDGEARSSDGSNRKYIIHTFRNMIFFCILNKSN